MDDRIRDMPKIECPFEKDEHHIVQPRVKGEFRWIFTPEAVATEKLDGTNVSVLQDWGMIDSIVGISNRENEIKMFAEGSFHYIEGIYEALRHKYIQNAPSLPGEKWRLVFGELIGPKLQGNPYALDRHLWIPFDVLKDKYTFRFWNHLVTSGEFDGKSDEELYEIVSSVFSELWSLFKRKRAKPFRLETQVSAKTPFTGLAAEGIVFYRANSKEMCKLRRDQFPWFTGRRH